MSDTSKLLTFPVTAPTCRDCDRLATVTVIPRVDHRRRKPWPQAYWLCDEHRDAPDVGP